MTRAELLEQLAQSIAAVRLDHPTRVAIDGVDGSGKTTLADELAEPVRRAGRAVIRASVDGFHNPRAVRYARGPDSPEGYFRDSFDYAALKRELLDPLGPAGNASFRTATFDYQTTNPSNLGFDLNTTDPNYTVVTSWWSSQWLRILNSSGLLYVP